MTPCSRNRAGRSSPSLGVAVLATVACTRWSAPAPNALAAPGPVIALVGGTIIDGNGGVPLANATLVIVGDHITKIGPSATTAIPPGAWRIDVRGKYLTPSFINTNVHLTWVGVQQPIDHKLEQQQVDQALADAESYLRQGVTTVRDTYGILPALLSARDSLEHGGRIGARLLVAGNIIGLSGDRGTPPEITQGVGRELAGLDADSLRIVIDHYLDKGMDFIKIAVTDHDAGQPEPLLFSLRALQMMVREAHQRGKTVDSHTTTPEGLRMAVLAGIDVVQHPEVMGHFVSYPMPSALAHLLATRPVICSVNSIDQETRGKDSQAVKNTVLLIQSGCRVSVATDEFGSFWKAVEGLVELGGMTPAQALTAATRNGAIAAGAAHEYGTLEVGKQADVLVLRADPYTNIRNIEKIELVFHHGYVIDTSGKKLPWGTTWPRYGY